MGELTRLEIADQLERFAYRWNEFKGSQAQRLVLGAALAIREMYEELIAKPRKGRKR